MLEGPRVLLRQWTDRDLPRWVQMNADPEVMRYFANPLSEEQALDLATRIRSHIDEHGWGLWALEIKESGLFAGFVGLSRQDLGLAFTPCIEIGWRLSRDMWGHGYATEAAELALTFGQTRFDEIYSYTSTVNTQSQAVMRRIGLVERPDLAFDHPRVEDPTLKPHVVFASA